MLINQINRKNLLANQRKNNKKVKENPGEPNEYRKLCKEINNCIEQISSYQDNGKFALFIRKYMYGLPLTDTIAARLHTIINQKNGNERRYLNVLVRPEVNSRELKICASNDQDYKLIIGIPNELPQSDEIYLTKQGDSIKYILMGLKGKLERVIEKTWLEEKLKEVNKAHSINYQIGDIMGFFENPNWRNGDHLTYVLALLVLIHSGREVQTFSDYYLSTGHASPLVEISDCEKFVECKIHENGFEENFQISRYQAKYNEYEANYAFSPRIR